MSQSRRCTTRDGANHWEQGWQGRGEGRVGGKGWWTCKGMIPACIETGQ
jgi:hypothetical protein